MQNLVTSLSVIILCSIGYFHVDGMRGRVARDTRFRYTCHIWARTSSREPGYVIKSHPQPKAHFRISIDRQGKGYSRRAFIEVTLEAVDKTTMFMFSLDARRVGVSGSQLPQGRWARQEVHNLQMAVFLSCGKKQLIGLAPDSGGTHVVGRWAPPTDLVGGIIFVAVVVSDDEERTEYYITSDVLYEGNI